MSILNPSALRVLSLSRSWKSVMLDSKGQPTREARRILRDLSKFCRATTTSFVPGDPHTTSMLEGRRETFNRIMTFIGFDESQIHNIATEENDD